MSKDLRLPQRTMGYTLIEVLIAVTLFSIAIGMVMESLLGARNYEAMGAAQDDVQLDGRAIVQSIQNDIVASAWNFPDESASYSGITAAADRLLQYYPMVVIQPGPAGITTGAPQHPDVIRHTRTPALSVNSLTTNQEGSVPGALADASTVFGTNRAGWFASYFARSQELIFVKATVSLWNQSTDSYSTNTDQQPNIQFSNAPRDQWITANNHNSLNILHASGWGVVKDVNGVVLSTPAWPVNPNDLAGPTADDSPYGVVMDGGMIANISDFSDIRPNWETVDGRRFGIPLGGGDPQPITTANLREYTYAVVPSQIGFGCLVRARRVNNATTRAMMDPAGGVWASPGVLISQSAVDTNDGMAIDKILSEHVTRILFDTYRTVDSGATSVTALDINQVKIRVYMARRSSVDPDLIIKRLFETVVSMRTMNSARDKDFSQQDDKSASVKLGSSPIGITN